MPSDIQNATVNSIPKERMPIGMVIISVWIGWSIIMIFQSLVFPSSATRMFVLFPDVIAGIVGFLLLGLWAMIFFAIVRKSKWGWGLTIGGFGVGMTLSIIQFILFLVNKESYFNVIRRGLTPEVNSVMTPNAMTITMLVGFVFSVVVDIIIIVYLSKKKNYFIN